MLKRIKRVMRRMYWRQREFYDHAEAAKFESNRPRDPFEITAIYGLMR